MVASPPLVAHENLTSLDSFFFAPLSFCSSHWSLLGAPVPLQPSLLLLLFLLSAHHTTEAAIPSYMNNSMGKGEYSECEYEYEYGYNCNLECE